MELTAMYQNMKLRFAIVEDPMCRTPVIELRIGDLMGSVQLQSYQYSTPLVLRDVILTETEQLFHGITKDHRMRGLFPESTISFLWSSLYADLCNRLSGAHDGAYVSLQQCAFERTVSFTTRHPNGDYVYVDSKAGVVEDSSTGGGKVSSVRRIYLRSCK